MRQAIARLPEKQRAAVLMHKYEEMEYSQIAKVLGCSESAVRSLLFRAYETLRARLAHFAGMRGLPGTVAQDAEGRCLMQEEQHAELLLDYCAGGLDETRARAGSATCRLHECAKLRESTVGVWTCFGLVEEVAVKPGFDEDSPGASPDGLASRRGCAPGHGCGRELGRLESPPWSRWRLLWCYGF